MAPNMLASRRGSGGNKRQRHPEHPQQQQPRTIEHYVPPYLRSYIQPYHGDFCYTTCFHPRLIAQLMAEGFLPIATEGILLPKLHEERCIIPLPDALHVSKSVRKKSKKFSLTVNQAFDEVVAGCHRQHGSHCWLYPPLVKAFRSILDSGGYQATVVASTKSEGKSETAGHSKKNVACPVRLYSIEVWTDTGGDHADDSGEHSSRLVAGELGYTVGSIYTSLTGFTAQDSAGSVQLAALGKLLILQGFEIWDLGMEMDYKVSLGSKLMPREEFVRTVHSVRHVSGQLQLPMSHLKMNCKSLIDGSATTTAMTQQAQAQQKHGRPGTEEEVTKVAARKKKARGCLP